MAGKTGKKWMKKAESLQLSIKFDNIKSAEKCYKFLNEELKHAKDNGDVIGKIKLVLQDNKVGFKCDDTVAKDFFKTFYEEIPASEFFTDERGIIRHK